MTIKKKHLYQLFALNALLPGLLFLLSIRETEKAWPVLPMGVLIVSLFTLVLIFLAWAAYLVITKKEPGNLFFLICNGVVTLCIVSIFGYFYVASVINDHFYNNRKYNYKYFDLERSPRDSFALEAFHQLERQMSNPNDIRLNRLAEFPVDTVINNVHDSVSYIYFTYSLKGVKGSLMSSHIAGRHINRLLTWNKPTSQPQPVK